MKRTIISMMVLLGAMTAGAQSVKYDMTYFDLTLTNDYGSNTKILYYDDLLGNSTSWASRSDEAPSWHIVAKKNGQEVSSGTVVVRDGDELSFSVNDADGNPLAEADGGNVAQWKLFVDTGEDEAWVKKLSSGASSCSFTMSETFLPRITAHFNDDYFSPFLTYMDSLTRSAYQRALVSVSLYTHDGKLKTYYFPLRFEVLPSVASLKILRYYEDVFTDGDYVDVMPIAEVEVDVRNSLGGVILTSPAEWNGAIGGRYSESTPMPYRLTVDWGSLGCGYACLAAGPYGQTISEWVFPDASMTNSVPRNSLTESVSITQQNGRLKLYSQRTLDLVSVSDASGRPLMTARQVKSIMTEALPRGVYFVKAGSGNHFKTTKIIIK